MWTIHSKGTSLKISPETIQVMTTLVKSIESRDPYTAGHTWRVSRYVMGIAKHLGWHGHQLVEAELGGLLHDLGKVKVPDQILNKPGALTADEYTVIREHPLIGADILRQSPGLVSLMPYIEAHHERFDGHGYPHSLSGQLIPLPGRIVAVADAFDAMTSTRPYRRALLVENALSEIEKNQGTQFDPDIVQVFLKAWARGVFRGVGRFSGINRPLLECEQCGPVIEITDPMMETLSGTVQCPVCRGLYTVAFDNGSWTIRAPNTSGQGQDFSMR
ncbi:MAG: HD-GYP domain-containing protein [Sulfobacillus sp.]